MKKSLTKTPDLFSEFAWELLLESEQEAHKWRHEYLDVEHLLLVLFTDQNYKSFINSLPIQKSILLDGLENFLANSRTSNEDNLYIGEDLEELLDTAANFRSRWGSKLIDISHILIAAGRDKRIGERLFKDAGMPSEVLEGELRRISKPMKKPIKNSEETLNQKERQKFVNVEEDINNSSNNSRIQKFSPEKIQSNNNFQIEEEKNYLKDFGRDLTEAAKNEELDPVIGRDDEIQLVIKVLSRRGKNNPVLIGAPGVGKTAIAELLAQRIIANEVPDSLKNLKLVSLDVGALIAGTKFRGQFEERLRCVLAKASDPDEGIILFIDELHTVLSTERSSTDAGSLLKPVLARGDLRCIGATTPENFRRTIEKDQALNRRFQKVLIKEPSIDLSVEILRGIKERYESHHEVIISDDALITANKLADRYINDRCLPDKAIDLIDEASAQLKMESTSKPLKLLDAEKSVEELNEELIQAESIQSQNQINEIKNKLVMANKKVNNLLDQWEQEKTAAKELKLLKDNSNTIQYEIDDAEAQGDLEKVARLKYDELHYLNERIDTVQKSVEALNRSGKHLLKNKVESEDIADVVARWTGIPVNKVLAGEKKKLLNLEIDLANKVIGQTEAVKAVSQAIKRARAGMKDSFRPIGSFLFLGPTGVGKTELAKSLAASLFDEEEALIRLDMSEFMERNAVARLIGAPPGYVGYEEGGQLTEAVRRRPYSVLLLDEIEKGHPDVFNILLQVLDDGRLTDSQGRTVDFRHTVVIMTSNLAGRKILENEDFLSANANETGDFARNLNKNIDEALRKHFRPEFLNRIDEIICFRPLSLDHLQRIIKLQLVEVTKLLAEQGLELRIDNSTIHALAKEGYEPEYGARPLRRILRRRIENPLATQLLEEKFVGANAVRIKNATNDSESLEFVSEN